MGPLRIIPVICLLLGLWDSTAHAAAPKIADVKAGISGAYKLGDWFPLTLTIDSPTDVPAARMVCISPDPEGQAVIQRFEIGPLPAGVSQRSGLVKAGRSTGEWILQLEADSGTVLTELRIHSGSESFPAGLKQSTELWGQLGLNIPLAIQQTEVVTGTGKAAEVSAEVVDRVSVVLENSAQIPEQLHTFDSLDLLLIAAGQAGQDGKLLCEELSATQVAMLREWVEFRGGHLIVSVGSEPEKFAATPLGQWLQWKFTGTTTLRRLNALEEYSRRREPLQLNGPISGLLLDPQAGTTLCAGVDSPLITQFPRGAGRVTCVSIDLGHSEIAAWPGLQNTLIRLTNWEREIAKRQVGKSGSQLLSQSGINDLQTQLVHGLDHFPEVNRVSLWVVMLGIGLYLLVIGPCDYFLVHHIWKQPRLTWITFPIWIVLGVGIATALANAWNGRQVLTRQWDLISIDLEQQSLRGRSWVMLYSPEARRTAVEAASGTADWPGSQIASAKTTGPQATDHIGRLSWVGTAESNFGGMYRTGGLQLNRRNYQQSTTGWSDCPLPVWTSVGAQFEWSQPSTGLVTSELVSSGVGRLQGRLSHELPGALEDCLLAFGNRVYQPIRRKQGNRVFELPARQIWEIGGGQQMEQRELRGLLTQAFTRVVRDRGPVQGIEVQLTQTPYDVTNNDPGYIFRMLTFHQAAGGQSYTGLRHDVLRELDLSPHLRLGQAVLFGRIRVPASQWTVGGAAREQTDVVTYVRMLLPVQKVHEAETLLIKPDEDLKGKRPGT